MLRSLLGEPPACLPLTLTLTLARVPLLQGCKAALCCSPRREVRWGPLPPSLSTSSLCLRGRGIKLTAPKTTAFRGRPLLCCLKGTWDTFPEGRTLRGGVNGQRCWPWPQEDQPLPSPTHQSPDGSGSVKSS